MGTPQPLVVSALELHAICIYLKRVFPFLASEAFSAESEDSDDYNCIAWAAEDVTQSWWPGDPRNAYWPISWREESVACFVAAFADYGHYEDCSADFSFDPTLEKLALFVHPVKGPTHMARQLNDGTWASKVGVKGWDIIHESVHGVEGDIYGTAVKALKRPR